MSFKQKQATETLRSRIQNRLKATVHESPLVHSEKLVISADVTSPAASLQANTSSLWWTKVNLATMQPTSLHLSNASISRKASADKPEKRDPRPRPRRKAIPPALPSQRGLGYEPLPMLDHSAKANKDDSNRYKNYENLEGKERDQERRKIEDCLKRILLRKQLRK